MINLCNLQQRAEADAGRVRAASGHRGQFERREDEGKGGSDAEQHALLRLFVQTPAQRADADEDERRRRQGPAEGVLDRQETFHDVHRVPPFSGRRPGSRRPRWRKVAWMRSGRDQRRLPVTPGNEPKVFSGRSSGLPSIFPAPSRAWAQWRFAESSGLQQRGLRRNRLASVETLPAPASRFTRPAIAGQGTRNTSDHTSKEGAGKRLQRSGCGRGVSLDEEWTVWIGNERQPSGSHAAAAPHWLPRRSEAAR